MSKTIPTNALQIPATDNPQILPIAGAVKAVTHHAPQVASSCPVQTVHIDRIEIGGHLTHRPLGHVFYALEDGEPVPLGSSAVKPQPSKNAEDVYVRSRHIEGAEELATWLEFNCCPPQILQGHNVFGHADMQDYVTSILDRIVAKFPLKLRPTPEEWERWHNGNVQVNHVHLAANFLLPEELKMPLIQAIDMNNPKGKKRDHLTSISLGFNGDRRSDYQAATVYCKGVELQTKWKRPGKYQTRIIKLMNGAIRVEVKLFRKALKQLGLARVKDWAGVDVNALFFDTVAKFNIANSVQPLLTEDECATLTRKQKWVYLSWLEGRQLDQFLSRTTVWKYVKEVKEAIGIDMSAHRRPDRLPALNMSEVLTQANILPVPEYLPGLPKHRYWAPGTAAAEFAAKQVELAKAPKTIPAKLRDLPADDELDAIAY